MSKKAQAKGKPPMSGADRVAKHIAARNTITRLKCRGPKRRERLEKNDAAWLKWYCPEAYFLSFEKPHKAIIEEVREAMNTAGDCVVAAERGIGKSAILYGLTLKLALTGEQTFPVYIPWGDKDKDQGFSFWLDCLSNNERIIADYPETCQPFHHAEGIAQRIATTTWADTGERTHAKSAITKGILVFPDGLGCIGSSTMNGNPRGMNYTAPGGKIVRPTMALIDDVQDDKTAGSQGSNGLVGKTIKKINGTIRGLKRAGAQFSILMSGNCIQHGDVMDHFLNQGGWAAVRVPCVERWPDGWDDPQSELRELWDEWGELFLAKDGEVAFFKKHRRKLCRGMVLTAPKTYSYQIKTASEDERMKGAPPVNAVHSVMREYYRMGDAAFMAERQQEPVDPLEESTPYTLSPQMVRDRATKLPPHQKPDWVVQTIATTDINPSYGLSTAILGFGQDQTCHILWYGIHKCHIPDDLPKFAFDKKLEAELAAHGKEIAGMPNRPAFWSIDAGGKNFDAVIRFAENATAICGIPAQGFRGTGARYYNEYGRTYLKKQPQREMCHVRGDHKNGRFIRWIPWQSDYWKEICQRAMLGELNASGSCSLPYGRHMDFAAQFCNERLKGKAEVGGKMVWVYNKAPGKNDFLDCVAQGYAAAAFVGIGTGGIIVKPKRYVERRKPKVRATS